jgi:hypothetical protein
MLYDRFKLEEHIMSTWATVESLKIVLANFDDMSMEDIKAVIQGTSVLAELGFSEMFKEFEKSIEPMNSLFVPQAQD